MGLMISRYQVIGPDRPLFEKTWTLADVERVR